MRRRQGTHKKVYMPLRKIRLIRQKGRKKMIIILLRYEMRCQFDGISRTENSIPGKNRLSTCKVYRIVFRAHSFVKVMEKNCKR